MKKGTLINSELSHAVARLGHLDGLCVCDAGLPIPAEPRRIDLALSRGIPSFIDTVKAVLSEMTLDSVEMAEEFPEKSPELHEAFMALLKQEEEGMGKEIPILAVRHEAFKLATKRCRAVVRTGEFTPYANVILKAGVRF
ncbi:D-ribose pyranase [Desulfoluna spongiiphila]|uniref:D-ribose pyranase n=1 Tax=Desulfoluna spongiiphila TaxID=419481 RepID=UPI001252C673|nr:D-ribose pyranase [Desulfoluna spongiiphila]VVS94135.1 d-ribose pyranase [Desulfoluna spongiiphila]